MSYESLDQIYEKAVRRIDAYLDKGAGKCLLKQAAAAEVLVESLHYFDGERYTLGCFVIMPNHCHAILTPLPTGISQETGNADGSSYPLERILHTWKRRSAFEINKRFDREGSLWQDESYDRVIRDEEHLYRSIQYIGKNPQVARLSTQDYTLWIRPEWVASGWGFA